MIWHENTNLWYSFYTRTPELLLTPAASDTSFAQVLEPFWEQGSKEIGLIFMARKSWLKESATASANRCWILFSSGFSFLVEMWTSSLGDSTMLVVMACLEVQPLVTMRLMSKTKPPLKMVVFKTFVHLVCFFPSFKANNPKY